MSKQIDTAMVLAAGLGTRMRPLTETKPKPLIEVGGETLLDRGLTKLEQAGVKRLVVNVHYLAEQIEAHLAQSSLFEIEISDERTQLLDSAGGLVKALPLLGQEPFYIINADTFWLEAEGSNLLAMQEAWDEQRMDILLMVVGPEDACGHGPVGDFDLDDKGCLHRAKTETSLIYAGAAIVHPRIFAGAEPVAHSLNRYFDQAIGEGRLYGYKMHGQWITVGTPDAINDAQEAIARFG